jgi:acetyl-CoA C-acetyltransferase
MAEAYIVEAVRTAGGKRGGALKDWHPADMAAEVLDALVERSTIDPGSVEDVIMGCVGQAGEQAFHIGRNAVLASKLPQSVPAVTIDRQCGSSQQALQFAAQAVMSGTQDVVIACPSPCRCSTASAPGPFPGVSRRSSACRCSASSSAPR